MTSNADAQPSTTVSTSAAPGLTTMGQTIVIGAPDDANGGYSRLQLGAGEPHVPRTDLSRTITPVSFAFTSFAQMTDLHIVDDQSPLRVEWLDRYGNQGPPHEESYPFRAAYRPHECLSTQVADAMCRNISMIGRGPRTGLPLAFTMVSGDGVDNCQFNEARWYVDVLDGQPITPNSGGSFDHSVTGDSLGLDINYWHPASRDFELSNTKGPGLDLYFQGGFPEAKQLPGAARQPFTAHGLRMPWFAAYGNHDTFVQGNVPIDGSFYGIDIGGALGLDLKSIATGTFKRTDIAEPLPARYTGDLFDYTAFGKLVVFQDFAGVLVPADPARQLLSKSQFITELFNTHGLPVGHGFDAQGKVAYYAMADPKSHLFRHIVLDTNNPAGGARGRLDLGQAHWLEQQLRANSSRFFTNDSPPALVEQSNVQDTLFVIHAHHPLSNLGSAGPLFLGEHELERLLLRFPNVVLFVNGHNHRNQIVPHPRTWLGLGGGGFWEVTTSSLADWPIQSRLFDITAGGGIISIFTTMVDLDAPLDFRQGDIHQPAVLASLARELAANDLQHRGKRVKERPGDPVDRNTQLLLPTHLALPNPIIFGSPIAATRGPGRPVLLVGTDGQDKIWTGLLKNGSVAWSILDGALRCVCVETNADGRVELFGVNRAGVPFHRSQTSAGSSSWSAWAQLPGQFTSIAAARNADGRLEVFATNMFERGVPDGPVGPLFHSTQVAPGSPDLTDWALLDNQGEIGLVQVAAAANADGRIALFGVTSGGAAVVHRVQTSPGSWAGSTWQSLDKPGDLAANAIAAGCGADGIIELFMSDEDGRVRHRRQNAPGASMWSDWIQLDADWARFTIRQLAVGSDGTTLTLVGIDADGHVYARAQRTDDHSAWKPWTALPGALRPTLLPSTAPQASSPGDQSTMLGTAVNLQLSAVGGIPPVTWTYAGLPPGLFGDPAGHITGAPAASGRARHVVIATASDANYAASTVSFTWTTLVTVPNVMGLLRADAVAELAKAHLAIGPDSLDNRCTDPTGTVLLQSLPPGPALEASVVKLTVSTGVDKNGHKCVFK